MNERQLAWERMVDGELSVEQQQAVLRECEARREWRGLALAYVESQTLGHELKRLANKESGGLVAAVDKSVQRRNREEVMHSHSRLGWRDYASAAAILIALALGFGLGWSSPRGAGDFTRAAQSTESTPAHTTSMPLLVSDPWSNRVRQLDLPMLQGSSLSDDWPSRLPRSMSKEMVNAMRDRGLHVTESRQFIPIQFSNGRRALVPVDLINFQRGTGEFH